VRKSQSRGANFDTASKKLKTSIGGMMKKFIWLAVALTAFAVSSQAQETPAADVSAGYSYFRVGGSGGANLNGFSTSAAYNANNWFGVVGDFGYYAGSPSGVSVNAFSYTFGPRFSIRGSSRFVPFAEALFGASHLSASFGGASGSSNPFTYSFGGGADVALSHSGKVSLRPEVEYFGLRTSGATTNCVRISVGIVYHIGERK
jgi:outer membrane protein with beta-barrel domain